MVIFIILFRQFHFFFFFFIKDIHVLLKFLLKVISFSFFFWYVFCFLYLLGLKETPILIVNILKVVTLSCLSTVAISA